MDSLREVGLPVRDMANICGFTAGNEASAKWENPPPMVSIAVLQQLLQEYVWHDYRKVMQGWIINLSPHGKIPSTARVFFSTVNHTMLSHPVKVKTWKCAEVNIVLSGKINRNAKKQSFFMRSLKSMRGSGRHFKYKNKLVNSDQIWVRLFKNNNMIRVSYLFSLSLNHNRDMKRKYDLQSIGVYSILMID